MATQIMCEFLVPVLWPPTRLVATYTTCLSCRSVWVVYITYGGFSVGSAIAIIPIYSDLLKIGE